MAAGDADGSGNTMRSTANSTLPLQRMFFARVAGAQSIRMLKCSSAAALITRLQQQQQKQQQS